MKILYLDCYNGITGGAFASAMMDACSNKQEILSLPEKLLLKDLKINSGLVTDKDILSVFISVTENKEPLITSFRYLNNILWNSELETEVKEKVHRILNRIITEYCVLFNISEEEAGLKSIATLKEFVEITVVCKVLNMMQIDKVYLSDIVIPGGLEINAIPRAAINMLKNRRIKTGNNRACRINLAGAAMIAELTESAVGKVPGYILAASGYGTEINSSGEVISSVRVLAGEIKNEEINTHSLIIEFNVDDMNPQQIPYLIERLLDSGAADAFVAPIIMKKGRPGFLVTVTCSSLKEEQVLKTIFMESTTIGVKKRKTDGVRLKRNIYTAATSYGDVKVKEIFLPDGSKRITPEYEDCVLIAKKENLPLKIVQEKIITELNHDTKTFGIFNN